MPFRFPFGRPRGYSRANESADQRDVEMGVMGGGEGPDSAEVRRAGESPPPNPIGRPQLGDPAAVQAANMERLERQRRAREPLESTPNLPFGWRRYRVLWGAQDEPAAVESRGRGTPGDNTAGRPEAIPFPLPGGEGGPRASRLVGDHNVLSAEELENINQANQGTARLCVWSLFLFMMMTLFRAQQEKVNEVIGQRRSQMRAFHPLWEEIGALQDTRGLQQGEGRMPNSELMFGPASEVSSLVFFGKISSNDGSLWDAYDEEGRRVDHPTAFIRSVSPFNVFVPRDKNVEGEGADGKLFLVKERSLLYADGRYQEKVKYVPLNSEGNPELPFVGSELISMQEAGSGVSGVVLTDDKSLCGKDQCVLAVRRLAGDGERDREWEGKENQSQKACFELMTSSSFLKDLKPFPEVGERKKTSFCLDSSEKVEFLVPLKDGRIAVIWRPQNEKVKALKLTKEELRRRRQSGDPFRPRDCLAIISGSGELESGLGEGINAQELYSSHFYTYDSHSDTLNAVGFDPALGTFLARSYEIKGMGVGSRRTGRRSSSSFVSLQQESIVFNAFTSGWLFGRRGVTDGYLVMSGVSEVGLSPGGIPSVTHALVLEDSPPAGLSIKLKKGDLLRKDGNVQFWRDSTEEAGVFPINSGLMSSWGISDFFSRSVASFINATVHLHFIRPPLSLFPLNNPEKAMGWEGAKDFRLEIPHELKRSYVGGDEEEKTEKEEEGFRTPRSSSPQDVKQFSFVSVLNEGENQPKTVAPSVPPPNYSSSPESSPRLVSFPSPQSTPSLASPETRAILGIWVIPPPPERKVKSIFVYFHGQAGTRGQGHRQELYKMLAKGLDSVVVAFDPRGYGDSVKIGGGSPTAIEIMEDGHAVLDFVFSEIYPRFLVPVFLWGHSLGGPQASTVAANLLELAKNSWGVRAEDAERRSGEDWKSPRAVSLPLTSQVFKKKTGEFRLDGLVLESSFPSLPLAAAWHMLSLPLWVLSLETRERWLRNMLGFSERILCGEEAEGGEIVLEEEVEKERAKSRALTSCPPGHDSSPSVSLLLEDDEPLQREVSILAEVQGPSSEFVFIEGEESRGYLQRDMADGGVRELQWTEGIMRPNPPPERSLSEMEKGKSKSASDVRNLKSEEEGKRRSASDFLSPDKTEMMSSSRLNSLNEVEKDNVREFHELKEAEKGGGSFRSLLRRSNTREVLRMTNDIFRYNTLDALKRLPPSFPVLIFHGLQDWQLTPKFSEMLREGRGPGHTSVAVLRGGHNDLHCGANQAKMLEVMERWLSAVGED